jgi:hypothetical protein
MDCIAKRWLVPIVAVAASAFALAACSSSSSPSASTTPTTSGPSTKTTTSQSPTPTSAAKASAVNCASASADQVATALGVQAIGPTSQVNGAVTVCLYASSTNPRNVTIRYQTGMSATDFATARAAFSQHGEPTQPVTGFGAKAYSSTIGSGQYVTNTLVVLKNSTEVQISAPASLARVDALANQILTKI